MTEIWVDTDFGFDDLWALLLLRAHGCKIAGLSLVAGNASLPQVAENARRAKAAYRFDWPVWQGAARPLVRQPETAERVLGPTGMRTRGASLPSTPNAMPDPGAVQALRAWLFCDDGASRTVLALGPLTNIALLLQQAPEAARRFKRLVWMGGSSGPGNHTPFAEFNAVADAEALALLAGHDVALDVVDLMFCRQVTFGEDDMPNTDQLTGDLLGGYLDIALERGRSSMAIYDPLAALALASPDTMSFASCELAVSTADDETYGATRMTDTERSSIRLATNPAADLGEICLHVLDREVLHGARQ